MQKDTKVPTIPLGAKDGALEKKGDSSKNSDKCARASARNASR